MRILITGSRGRIGKVVISHVSSAGYEARSFDLAASGPSAWDHLPGSILDGPDVRRAVMGCEAIVHLAAIPNDRPGLSDLVMASNLMGTWNVLQAAVEAEVKKVIFFSSAQALGIWAGRRGPDYLPIDDAHPHYPVPAYGLSKHLGEEMCESFTRTHGLSTYCLRPCFVEMGDGREWRPDLHSPRARRWLVGDYYAYVDVRDVARAVLLCLQHQEEKHHGRYLLAAASNVTGQDTKEILQDDYPAIPWRGSPGYLDRPDRGLVDTSAAFRDLGWKPEFEKEKSET